MGSWRELEGTGNNGGLFFLEKMNSFGFLAATSLLLPFHSFTLSPFHPSTLAVTSLTFLSSSPPPPLLLNYEGTKASGAAKATKAIKATKVINIREATKATELDQIVESKISSF